MYDLARRIIFTIIMTALMCTFVSVAYYRSLDFIPFMLGVLLGSAVSITKVFLLKHTVDKALEMEQKQAGFYTGTQHIFRLLITGVVLFIGATVQQISLWGVAAGILSLQLSIYLTKLTSKSGS